MRYSPLFLLLVACEGGGGAFLDDLVAREIPPNSFERSGSSQEGAPSRTSESSDEDDEQSAGSGANPSTGTGNSGSGSSALNCTGSYRCRETGSEEETSITLNETNGVCTATLGQQTVIVQNDGNVLVNGQSVGRWSGTSSGFIVTSSDGVTTCTRN